MTTKDLREATRGAQVAVREARAGRRGSRGGAKNPYSAFERSGVRRFERIKSTYTPFRVY